MLKALAQTTYTGEGDCARQYKQIRLEFRSFVTKVWMFYNINMTIQHILKIYNGLYSAFPKCSHASSVISFVIHRHNLKFMYIFAFSKMNIRM